VTTNPNGRFELTGLAPDKYLLRFISEKMGSGYVTLNVESGQSICDVRIPLTEGVPFEVMVYDTRDEKPVENATVEVTKKVEELRHPIFRQTVTTDANGLARLSVPPGECDVRAWKLGRGWADHESVQIAPDETFHYEVFLPQTNCILSGDVLNEKGQPLSDALVRLWPGGFGLTYTDANGQFDTSHIGLSITPMPSKEQVFVRHVPSGSAAIGVLRDPTKSGNLHGRVILKPAYTLTGCVTDRAGNRLPAALVRLLVSGPSTGSLSRFITEVATDMNGTYCIPSIPSLDDGWYYAVAARAEGFGSTEVTGIRLHGDTARPVHVDPIVLQPADRSISGVVEDANGRRVAGALVGVYGLRLSDRASRQPHGQTLTDAQGRFRITGVCEEPLRVHAESASVPKQPGETWAHGGSEDVRVVLGQKLIFSKSLAGKPMPRFEGIKIDFDPQQTKGMILLCFFDMNQRPSRHCIKQLAEQAKELQQKGVTAVAVQVSKIKRAKLDEWIEENSISLPVGMIQGEEEETRLAWGVRSLPWLILTDSEHIIRAEGFVLAELDARIEETGR
jgi:protocatechuate 3,4-dioxygenase beta subunit